MSENTKSFRSHFRLAAAMGLVAVIIPSVAVPLTGSVISAGRNPFSIKAEVMKKAQNDRARVRAKNRAYVKAADNCVDQRAETGEDIDCPDVNDESTFRSFLTQPHEAAPEENTVSSELDALSQRDRLLVEQSVSAGYCSERLIAKGLYRFCKSMLQEDETPRGFINHRVYLEIDKALAFPRDLRTRVRQMKNARGTTRYRSPSSTREGHYQAK